MEVFVGVQLFSYVFAAAFAIGFREGLSPVKFYVSFQILLGTDVSKFKVQELRSFLPNIGLNSLKKPRRLLN
jgi:hypothetical protein